MIIVMKLISGEEIIGSLPCETNEEFNMLLQYELTDPMWIVPTDSGAMKLRDACMLSDNEQLILTPDYVILSYNPSVSLTKYYLRVCEYSKDFTRPNIASQIDLATEDLEQQIRDEKKEAIVLGELYRKITGSKLH